MNNTNTRADRLFAMYCASTAKESYGQVAARLDAEEAAKNGENKA